MLEISKTKLKELLRYSKKQNCSRHPDYPLKYFCQVKNCSHGLVCDACEELEHSHLQHHRMTQGLNPNFIEIDEFFDSLLDTGLYYELGDDLHKVFHENDLKKLRKDKSKMISARDTSKSSALEILEQAYQDVLSLLQKKHERLKKDVSDWIDIVYDLNISLLENFNDFSSELKQKRDLSLKFVWQEIDRMKTEDDFDSESLAITIQGYLNATFTENDVRVMSGLKHVTKYLGSKEVFPRFSTEALESCVKNLKNQIGIIYGDFPKAYCIQPEINLNQFVKSIGKYKKDNLLKLNLYSRVQVLGQDEGEVGKASKGNDQVSAIAIMDEENIAVGTSRGFLKIFEKKMLVQENLSKAITSLDNNSEDQETTKKKTTEQELRKGLSSNRKGVVSQKNDNSEKTQAVKKPLILDDPEEADEPTIKYSENLSLPTKQPQALYTSNSLFHRTMIKHVSYQVRASDKKRILISSDVLQDIVISE